MMIGAMLPNAATASTATSDLSDWWYSPSESGWGINVLQQSDILGVAFFVFDTSGKPVWYTTALTYQGNFVWSGDLLQTTGPYFGGPFTGGVVRTKVGTATFAATTLNSATLTYTVNGVNVSKSVQRLTFKNENLTGTYIAAVSEQITGCSNPSNNGSANLAGNLSVTQNGADLNLTLNWSNGVNCTGSGQYTQTGKLGSWTGTQTCDNGGVGNISLLELTPTISGFTARFQGTNNVGCSFTGYFGAVTVAH